MKPIRGNLSRPGLPPLFLERRGAGGGGGGDGGWGYADALLWLGVLS